MTRIYAAMREELLVADDGAGWESSRRLDGHGLQCVAAHPDEPERVFVGTSEGGLQRSENGGETFERAGEGVVGERVMALAIDPTDPNTVWAGTEPSAVYRSTDGGDSWAKRDGLTDLPSASEWYYPPRPDTHHVRWLEPAPRSPEHLYVGIEAGALVQSHDAGETWEDRVSSARWDNHSLTTHPDAPDRVWSAAGDGYAESHDGGDSWSYPQEGLDHRYCWSVALDPADPDTVLLSSARGPRSAHSPSTAESYVYRKRGGRSDGGDADRSGDDSGVWERLDDRGLPMGAGVVRATLAAGERAGTCHAVTNHGLFFTTDAGDSWTALGVEWPDAFESQAPQGLAVCP